MSLFGSLINGYNANRAAEKASNAQIQSNDRAIAEQKRQFDALQALLKPYVSAGTGALTQTQGLLGLNGADAQQQAIQGLQNSPLFASMMQQGTNAILQNASATGGLRGGNTQAALAQFAPQVLGNLYQNQLQNLGGLVSLGQSSAAGQGNAGMNMASNIGALQNNIGTAYANKYLAQGQIRQDVVNSGEKMIGQLLGFGGLGGGGF